MTWAAAVSLHQALGLTEWAGTCCISPRITSPSCMGVVGKPMPHARAWLVDPGNEQSLAPIGAVAELCIEGTCLAQGYLNDSGASSKAFIVHPGWAQEPLLPAIDGPRRLYKTGDLVRYMCDGSIQHVGRKCMQRKVRGERIEITEVEYHLRQHFPEALRVFAEIITPCDDAASSSVLTAFLQLDQPGAEPNGSGNGENWFSPVGQTLQERINATREALFSQVPRYMIPDLFLCIREVPFTVSGKLDRRRLSNYANQLTRYQLLGKDQANGSRRAPATEMETTLLALFASSLKTSVDMVGVDDNFFHLGGDSIKPMALAGRARSQYELRITVGEILTHPTVSQLAVVIAEKTPPPEVNGVLPFSQLFQAQTKEEVVQDACKKCQVKSDTIEDIYPCTPLQQEPVWHESATLFTRDERDEKPELLVDFGHPLARISIHRDNTSNCIQLALTMHHSVIDGWCFRKILDQVEAVYHGKPLTASPPFATFVQYLSQLPDHKAYWMEYFSGLNTESQYQGNSDIVYGVTVSGRNAPVPGILTMTSPTVATMPFRVQLDPAASIADTLDSVVAQTVRSIPHEQTGLQNIRKFGEDVAAACEFQTLLVIQHIESTTGYSLLGAEARETSLSAFGTHALTLVCNLNADPVELKAWHDPKIVPERQVCRILGQLKHVVENIFKSPAATVNDCMTVSPSDAEEISAWNRPVPALSQEGVEVLFRQQCVAHPNQLAVDGWDVQFSYQSLDEHSTQLAKHLVSMKIGSGEFVPICTEKPGWTIVCMFAVIKTGAAFFLLDPTVLKQRLASSCQQAKSKLVLTTTGTLPLALELVANVVLADDLYPARTDISLPAIEPDHPLFAAFTSGSSGVPKAAVASHQSFLSYSLPVMTKMEIDGTVRWL
ncbi:unnamed protein product [Penicillium olsonii]|nr:unnamed protein product [Penicillium olsonii]